MKEEDFWETIQLSSRGLRFNVEHFIHFVENWLNLNVFIVSFGTYFVLLTLSK